MNLSQEVIDDVLHEYRRTRSPFRTATATGIDVKLVWQIVDQHSDKLSSFSERNGGLGRPEMQRYLVARRQVTARQWDNDLPEIAKARANYESGTIEMMTGRDGGWLILYAIPRKKTSPRQDYFKPEAF